MQAALDKSFPHQITIYISPATSLGIVAWYSCWIRKPTPMNSRTIEWNASKPRSIEISASEIHVQNDRPRCQGMLINMNVTNWIWLLSRAKDIWTYRKSDFGPQSASIISVHIWSLKGWGVNPNRIFSYSESPSDPLDSSLSRQVRPKLYAHLCWYQ